MAVGLAYEGLLNPTYADPALTSTGPFSGTALPIPVTPDDQNRTLVYDAAGTDVGHVTINPPVCLDVPPYSQVGYDPYAEGGNVGFIDAVPA